MQYIFLRKYLNITATATAEFAVGLVEGIIEYNITTKPKGEHLAENLAKDPLVQSKTKNILRIVAGGAITKATPVICEIGKTIAGATLNLQV